MNASIGLVLDGAPGDAGFVDAAIEAVRRVRIDGIDVDVRPSPPRNIPINWTGVLAHGSSLTSWALGARSPHRVVVLSDLPDGNEDLDGISFIDWAWDEGYAVLGAVAASLPGEPAVTLVTGPDFPPQRRIANAFFAALADRAPHRQVFHVSLESFTDESLALSVFETIVSRSAPNDLIVSAAGRAGDRLCELVQNAGMRTFGFSADGGGHAAWVKSDIAGVIERALRAMHAERRLPQSIYCGFESEFLTLDSAENLDLDRFASREAVRAPGSQGSRPHIPLAER